ncbi:D-glycero-D-manno-heptose 1 [Sporomusaceae bacterium BoRhaA]|uniref:D-glycero-beta-D-manno-heptose 1,7-bisphosphate 7-phosphatase n=1 Tax=Pelorhabdus rhamnosifermentans TaxID=2772457 RepID=UPI001C060C09|nr:D-glycero-beta-D-manno-heptose 1,7-bisphosphate 7-phosphatase [Pelorhabdus rhamnosifermentans]MBU2699021.1 D-glycero-D-manno-heptose 1 [Pelorhabdus rhamnosifermentans]
MLKRAIFLDRDGVINIDRGYVHRKEDFCWVDGAIETVRQFNELDYLVFVVTNQGGIARAFYTEQDVLDLHNWLQSELNKQGAHIDQFYYCPHHVEGSVPEHSHVCSCRKPEPGMILAAAQEWPVDLNRSVMIGDKPSDMEAAKRAGVTGYLFCGGNLFEFCREKVWNS